MSLIWRTTCRQRNLCRSTKCLGNPRKDDVLVIRPIENKVKEFSLSHFITNLDVEETPLIKFTLWTLANWLTWIIKIHEVYPVSKIHEVYPVEKTPLIKFTWWTLANCLTWIIKIHEVYPVSKIHEVYPVSHVWDYTSFCVDLSMFLHFE